MHVYMYMYIVCTCGYAVSSSRAAAKKKKQEASYPVGDGGLFGALVKCVSGESEERECASCHKMSPMKKMLLNSPDLGEWTIIHVYMYCIYIHVHVIVLPLPPVLFLSLSLSLSLPLSLSPSLSGAVCIGMIWDSEQPSVDDIMSVVESVGTILRVSDVRYCNYHYIMMTSFIYIHACSDHYLAAM